MKIRKLWHLNEHDSAIKEDDLTLPSPGKYLIKSLYSFVSQGTERLVATGMAGNPDMERFMSVPHMEGTFSLPCTYGYSLVGEILTDQLTGTGRIVHALHPHQDYLVLGEQDFTEISNTLPPTRATLISNMETAVNAIWDSGMSIGDKVLVVGYGSIGALIARLAHNLGGTRVFIAEENESRKMAAIEAGYLPYDETEKYDLAFNTSGHQNGLQTCIDTTRFEGTIVEMSWYGEKKVSLSLGSSFHYDRKKIISSQVSNIPRNRTAGWDFYRRKMTVTDLLKDPFYDTLITSTISFEDTPAFFARLRAGAVNDIGTIIKYS